MIDRDRLGHYLHKEHPKTKDENDFWGQVCRTVNGEPVSKENINLIVDAINLGLDLQSEDQLLDLGCGNGALSVNFFDAISFFKGVDFSEYLINIAKKNFEKKPKFTFHESDAIKYLECEVDTLRYTKALCYGVFSYFSYADSIKLLNSLHDRFKNVDTLYIGNLPDKSRVELFFPEGKDYTSLIQDPLSTIGIWRTQDEMVTLANSSGWDVDFYTMPESFYASHYRYDAKLTRK